MKTVVKMLLALAVVALVVPAFGQDAKPKRERPSAFGEIVKADAKTITLKTRTDPKDKNSPTEEKTLTLADDAKVMVDGEAKTVADLTGLTGKRAAVWCNADKAVTRISVMTKAREHKKPADK